MKDNSKKPKTVSELVKNLYPTFLKEHHLSQFKEIGKQQSEILENIKKITHPVIEQINRAKENARIYEPVKYELIYSRPVEYDILEELQELNKNHKRLLNTSEKDNFIIYNIKDGSLDRNIGGKCFSYDLTENGKRKRLLEILLDRGTYVQTKDLEKILSCPSSQAIAKIAQTFNDYAINTLRLNKKIKIIQGKKGSGYRINPKIQIEKE